MAVDKKLLDVMACPKCMNELKEKNMFLVCAKCKLAYPVLDGVPDMLVDEAWALDKADKAGFKHGLKL